MPLARNEAFAAFTAAYGRGPRWWSPLLVGVRRSPRQHPSGRSAVDGLGFSRRIAATPDRVWGLLVDLPSWRSWNPTIVRIEGDVRPGGTVRLVSKVNEKRTFALRVTELAQPGRLVWASGMPLGLFRGVRTYSLAPAVGGGTDFAMTEEYSGALAGLIVRSIPDLNPSFEAFADGLKAAAERG